MFKAMHCLYVSIFLVVGGLQVGCGNGEGKTSVVHSKEDRLKYIAQMEAMEKGTEKAMTEGAKEGATQ